MTSTARSVVSTGMAAATRPAEPWDKGTEFTSAPGKEGEPRFHLAGAQQLSSTWAQTDTRGSRERTLPSTIGFLHTSGESQAPQTVKYLNKHFQTSEVSLLSL